jgi:hypothetical protein
LTAPLPGSDEQAAARRSALDAVDPTAYLLADHAWLRGVIAELRPASSLPSALPALRESAAALVPRIETHIRLEEEAYFPAIEAAMQALGQGSTFDMYGEHDAIRIRSEELIEALGRTNDVPHAFANFARSLLIHFDNEEELVFAEAPESLTAMQRREIIEHFGQIDAAAAGGEA